MTGKTAIAVAGLFPLVVRALLLPAMPQPTPRSHDEFSYLLAADTFAHGRLVNPPHPFAMHFESMHILVRPVYASIYPVAQGMVLAFGQILFRNPWIGVWMSVGLMGSALCWALQGWVSVAWALFGSLLFTLRLGIFSYWMNSYWGGAVAACGGALVLGALPRMLETRSRMAAVWMGIGLAVLANSRPFEGLIFAVVVLGIGFFKAKRRPMVWPAVLVLAATGLGMSYYFHRVTGHAFLMPYVLYRSQTSAPHFVWQSPRPAPVFHHDALRRFDDWEMTAYRTARAQSSFVRLAETAQTYWRFYLGMLLSVPLFFVPWKVRDARILCGATALFFLCALSVQVWHSPHYAAPATVLAVVLVTMGARQLWGSRLGRSVVCALPVLTLATLVIDANSRDPAAAGSRWGAWQGRAGPRAAVLERIKRDAGTHLVMVRYAANHDVTDEWVYNEAAIDHARVVWAREMGPLRDGKLMKYFAGRKIWLAEPDAGPPWVSPYPLQTVRDPGILATGILAARADSCGKQPCRLTCDQWNYLLMKTTGSTTAGADEGCVAGNDRGALLPFEDWFAWLQGER